MYTQCPHCAAAFRISVNVLQQARGQVRCGSCDHAFNALDHLSDEPPMTRKAEPESPFLDEAHGEEKAERSQLLETLDRLAGSEEIRIEDTGVEWRVVDDDEEPPPNGDQPGTDPSSMRWVVTDGDDSSTDDAPADELISDTAETAENEMLSSRFAAADDEPRYDDNTLLPDDFEEQHQRSEPSPAPRRRASDRFEFVVENEDAQPDLNLSEPGDWNDLLDDLGGAAAEPSEAPAAEQIEEAAEAALAGELTEQAAETAEGSDEIASLTASMEPVPDAEQAIAMVASQLDDLLETQAHESEVEKDEAQEEAQDDDDTADAVSADAELEQAAPSEQPVPYGGDQPVDASAAEANDTRPATADESVPAAEQEPASDIDFSADSEPVDSVLEDIAAAAEAVDVDADDEAYEPVDASDSSGEFERAIAIAEDQDELSGEFTVADTAEDDGTTATDEDDTTATEEDDESPTDDPRDLAEDIAAMTGNMQIDPDVLLAMQDADLAATMTNEDGSPIVETIVMEGDFVSDALRGDDGLTDTRETLKDPGSLLDTYIMRRRDEAKSSWLSRRSTIGVLVILGLVLVAQLVHQSRESLATIGAFNQTIGPIYRLFGSPVTPNWNIKGWQFEETNGSTDEDESVLTIYSRIANRTDGPLPYPLVHVSLTDRYEDIMGSRMLEPSDYLAGNADPSRMVAAGANFNAVITIASPATEAVGFKLNVCYRAAAGTVRCAIEDFKTP